MQFEQIILKAKTDCLDYRSVMGVGGGLSVIDSARLSSIVATVAVPEKFRLEPYERIVELIRRQPGSFKSKIGVPGHEMHGELVELICRVKDRLDADIPSSEPGM